MLPNFSRGLKWNPVRSQKPSSFFLNKLLGIKKKKKMLKTYFTVSHIQSWMTMSVFNPLQRRSWGIKPLFLTYVLILAVVELRAALVWLPGLQVSIMCENRPPTKTRKTGLWMIAKQNFENTRLFFWKKWSWRLWEGLKVVHEAKWSLWCYFL